MHQPDNARMRALLLAVAMIALGVAFVWLHLSTPSDGAVIPPNASSWHPNGVVVRVLHSQPGGLRSGDLVVAVGGQSVESWQQALTDPTRPRPQWHFGQTLTYTIVRDGAKMDVPVTLGPNPLDAIWQEGWSTIVFALVFVAIAVYVVLRRPGDWAPLVLLISASGILGATTWTLGLQVSDLVNGLGFWLYKATTSVDFLLFYIAALHFVLVFPKPLALFAANPRLIWALYAVPFVLDALYLAVTRLTATSALEWIGRTTVLENLLVPALALLIIGVTIWTYRVHRDDDTRTKLRWVVFGGLVSLVSGLLLWELPTNLLGHPLISTNALGLLVLPLPLSIGVAILRNRLFDIDTILNRTLVYGGLSTIVAGIYIAIVATLGTVFQAQGNLLIALVAAGVVAVLFQPLRIWLQNAVNRLLFGERDDPYAVLSRLGRQLEVAIAPEAVLPTIVETVAHALKLPSVAIAVREGEQLVPGVEYGVPSGTVVSMPLIYQSDWVGELRVSPRGPDESLTVADKHLLEDIAHQAGIAVHATRLTSDLQRSRLQLITAREEERRRMRRDLHDGVGPTLAGMTLKIGAIGNLLQTDAAAASRMLGELGTEIESAMSDIRRLVYALRPPALDELGLVAALRAHAAQYYLQGASEDSGESRLLVTIHAPERFTQLPAAVEVAAYRIACEAITNTARHAQAQCCQIVLALDNALHLDIRDDGVGLASERRVGIGLVSMRERAEELGGICTIASSPGSGVHISAILPLTKE
jgi:two-component system, NarL family, sensor kinase